MKTVNSARRGSHSFKDDVSGRQIMDFQPENDVSIRQNREVNSRIDRERVYNPNLGRTLDKNSENDDENLGNLS